MNIKDRHLYGAGAAACAVCCAAPILALLGIAGAAATVATFVFAGTAFAMVVASGAFAYWTRRRRAGAAACAPAGTGPVELDLTARR